MSEEKKKTEATEPMDVPEPPRYMAEALLLANSYTKMLEERARLEKLLAGSWVYTKDMAIDELDNITVSYKGERVQSSNISNPTERIALKLTDEYMARKQAEMDAERNAVASELEYLNWKIGVVETVWHERMKGTQKSVFQLLYYQHKTFEEAKDLMLRRKKMKLYNRTLVRIKAQIWLLFDKEIGFCAQSDSEAKYVEMLTEEVRQKLEGEYGRRCEQHNEQHDAPDATDTTDTGQTG